MEQIKVHAYIPRESALAAGRAQYGDVTVALSDEDVQQLSIEARSLLAEVPPALLRLDVTEAAPSAVVAALEAAVQRRAAERAADAARTEARIAQALARPDAEWIDRSDRPALRNRWGLDLSERDLEDPRVVARRAQIEREVLPPAVAEWEQRQAAERAEREAAEAAAQQRSAEVRAMAARYVLARVPDLARSAKEGLDVVAPAKAAQLDDLRTKLHAWTGADVLADTYGTREHAHPRARAWELYDLVRTSTAQMIEDDRRRERPSLIREIAVEIVRADTCSENGCKSGWRTCVRVKVTWIDDAQAYVTLYADAAVPHVHASDEDDC